MRPASRFAPWPCTILQCVIRRWRPSLRIAAQLLASQACPQGSDQHLDVEPRVQEALLWLWALAEGPAVPDTPTIVMPPLHDTDTTPVPLPGGDPVAFTAQHWPCWKRCSLRGTKRPSDCGNLLAPHADALARRALMLIDAIVQQETARVVEAGVMCRLWGRGARRLVRADRGETLCEACYETRVTHGQAHPPSRDEEAGVSHVAPAPWAAALPALELRAVVSP